MAFGTKFSLTLPLWLGVGLALLSPASAWGRPPTGPEFSAAARIGQEVAGWVRGLRIRKKNKDDVPRLSRDLSGSTLAAEKRGIESLALFSVQAYEPFDGEFANVIESEIAKNAKERGIEDVSLCTECRNPRVSLLNNEVVITKGAADAATIKSFGEKLNVDAILVAEIFRTEESVIAQVAVYSTSDAALVATERFEADAENLLSFEESPVQLLITAGTGMPLVDGNSNDDGIPTSFNIQLAEEMGFARGGLNLGLVMAAGEVLIHLDPTISFHGRFGNSYLGWVLNLGAGYGLMGEHRGITGRGSFELLLGSTAVLGMDGVMFFPNTENPPDLRGYVGFHIGLAFGR